ncbi:MAG: MFS transporter [Spirochaetales bacterium]|nr:MFS transporter [Spirochaetales bacterium]
MPKIKLKTALGFSVGDVGGNLYFSMMGFILIYYLTEHRGLTGTLAGSAMMIGKIWDAITDPIVSSISDRTNSKYGRRRPFIFWGALLLGISVVLMFSMPQFSSQFITFLVATILFCTLSTAYTLVNIPYASLQPELTDDYNEKTKITGMRMGFAILGTLLAVMARPIAEFFGLENGGWTKMAIIMGSIMLVSSWVTVFTVKEKPTKRLKKQKGVLISYKEAFTNREFLLALFPWTLFVTAVTIIQGSFLYFFKYIFNNEGLFEISLFGLIIISLLSLPLWVKISKKISKGKCYMLGMGFFAASLLISYFLYPFTGYIFPVIILIISGVGFSTHYIMPHSIIPDIVELDYIRTEIRREGVYYSIWNFVMKLGQAFAGLLIGLTLDIIGFVPPINNEAVLQSDFTLKGIGFLCGPIPFILILTGLFILNKYPIDLNYYKNHINRKDRLNA